MSDLVEAVIGETGVPLPNDVADLVNDADSAVVFEQSGWLRSALLVTTGGHLLRRVDAGHVPHGGRCLVCRGEWPCASRRLEVEASQLALDLPTWGGRVDVPATAESANH